MKIYRIDGSIICDKELIIEHKLNLRWANLEGAKLLGLNLQGADLRDSWLMDANFHGSNLCGADFERARMRFANLSNTDLRAAYFHKTDLFDTYFKGAQLNWTSHELLSELLRQSAGNNVKRLMVAGLPLVTREWCWKEYLKVEIDPEIKKWVKETLSKWSRGPEEIYEETSTRSMCSS